MIEHLFIGNALCPIGAGGRMTLPAFVRTTLSLRASARRMFVGLHEADTCLVAFDPGELAELRSDCRRRRIAEEGFAQDQSHMRLRRIFGMMDDVWVRDSGRIVLSPMLQRRARIENAVLVIGTGGSFELWNPQLALDAGDPDLRELAAFHLELKQAA